MIDLSEIKHIHFTGIKGVAMTALAICVKDLGIKITGSDTEEIFVTDKTLKDAGIKWNPGFGEKNLDPKPDLLVTTGAHKGLLNPEVVKAKELGIKVLTYAEFLAVLANNKKLLSVCGVGGKGTTSSIIATILELSGVNPSFAIGMGNIFPIERSGRYDRTSEYFVCEADEYAISPGVNDNPKFSILNPFITVVTNVEHDHPDIYPTFEDTLKVYKEYFSRIPKDGKLIAYTENTNTKAAVQDYLGSLITFGLTDKSDWQAKNIKYLNGKTTYEAVSKKGDVLKVRISLPGEFNVLNSLAAIIVALEVGVPREKALQSLEKYIGARRRFENMGKVKGVLYYDDYAHHPGEITAVINAAKDWYPDKRIIAIFQPHTYSRTKKLFDDFTKAFKHADTVGFMDIYASARESKDDSISSEMLAESTKKYNQNSLYLGNHESTLKWLKKNTRKGDLVLTMGAGDIFHIYNNLKGK